MRHGRLMRHQGAGGTGTLEVRYRERQKGGQFNDYRSLLDFRISKTSTTSFLVMDRFIENSK